MISQDVTGLIYDETCTGAAALEIAIRLIRPSGHTKEIKKIKRIGRLAIIAASAACGRSVHCSFRIDVDYSRIDCRCNLRKLVRERHGVRNDQSRRFLSLARCFNPTRDDRPNYDADRKGCNDQGEIKQSLIRHGLSLSSCCD